MSKQPVLIPSAEVCKALSIDRSTLTRAVASGKIQPAVKAPGIRGAYLFTEAEVERLRTERSAA